jgi:prepilin-type N-terminal cleavage/methylation domain-containing protein
MRRNGFTLIEMLVALVASSILVSALFKLWTHNKNTSDYLATKGDFRDRSALATSQLNRSITMAGFGISRMDVLRRGHGYHTDTLTVFANNSERRTTLIDSAMAGSASIKVFKDSGFAVGCFLGITDSLKHEYARISAISGDSVNGFELSLTGGLSHTYAAGVPDIYPVQRERFFIDSQDSSLVRYVDDRRMVVVRGIHDFRIQFLDHGGTPVSQHKDIRVVSFSLTGTYKAPAGTPSTMSFSSTVIPRNIL